MDVILKKWPLDAWSIGPNTFNKITEILPVGSTILEFGSGPATDLLGKFYNMKSIEDDPVWVGRYNSTYYQVPLTPSGCKYPEFPGDPYWFDETVLQSKIESIGTYDAILVDGPKGYRGGLYYNHSLFNFRNTTVIFDDIHDKHHFKLMEMIAHDVSRPYQVFKDSNNKEFGILLSS